MSKEVKAKEEDVTVTMTPAQKEMVLKLLAVEADKNKIKAELVDIHLNFEHQRNETKYFGKVTVPADLGSSLLVADQKMLEARLRENQSNNHLIEIVGRGASRMTTTKGVIV